MRRERALKVVLVLVGLLFTALVYPLVLFVKQDPALAMMMSLYVTLGRSAWRCPAWRRAQPTGHPGSRFTENFWHVCLLIVRLSRVRLWFASASTTAPNCSLRTRMLLRDRPLSQLHLRAGSPVPRHA